MGADDCGVTGSGAGRSGDQVGDAAAPIVVGLLLDFEAGFRKVCGDIVLCPFQAVALEHRARADLMAEHPNVVAQRLFQGRRQRP